jgi:hypothetical protein
MNTGWASNPKWVRVGGFLSRASTPKGVVWVGVNPQKGLRGLQPPKGIGWVSNPKGV